MDRFQDNPTITIQWLLYLLTTVTVCEQTTEYDRDFWFKEGTLALRRRLIGVKKRPFSKNVVLLVGDGLGIATLTAARIFKGQRRGALGEDESLAWDSFPAVALAKTYNLNAQVGESSACATALLCGVKANYETVGLDSRGQLDNCSSSFGSRVESLLDWAQRAGKATGMVTNTRVSHATPAALYAHSPSRYWEDDSKVPLTARRSCKDITRQLVEDDPGRHLHVILGGGRRQWLPRVAKDPEDAEVGGRRLDGRNLLDDWMTAQNRKGLRAEYVWSKDQLEALNLTNVDRLLGLFSSSHMNYEAHRLQLHEDDPSLSEMTKVALSMLTRNSKGFFLFIESGRIDHAHHYNNPYLALDETLVLEAALKEVLKVTDPQDTLIVLTSDHSHVLTLGGLNAPRGNPILGVDAKVSDVDGLPYSTLLYGNGPGHYSPRSVPVNVNYTNAMHSSAVPRHWATHGGEDVPVFAQGPLATTLFSGTMDQSVIPHAIAYISCMGQYDKRCRGGDDFPVTDDDQKSNRSTDVHEYDNSRLKTKFLSDDLVNPSSFLKGSPQDTLCILLIHILELQILLI